MIEYYLVYHYDFYEKEVEIIINNNEYFEFFYSIKDDPPEYSFEEFTGKIYVDNLGTDYIPPLPFRWAPGDIIFKG